MAKFKKKYNTILNLKVFNVNKTTFCLHNNIVHSVKKYLRPRQLPKNTYAPDIYLLSMYVPDSYLLSMLVPDIYLLSMYVPDIYLLSIYVPDSYPYPEYTSVKHLRHRKLSKIHSTTKNAQCYIHLRPRQLPKIHKKYTRILSIAFQIYTMNK